MIEPIRPRMPCKNRALMSLIVRLILGAMFLWVWANARAQAASTVELMGLQDGFKQVADRVSPSVLAICASTDDVKTVGVISGESLQRKLDRSSRTVGTAFCIDAAGYLLTNEHVVANNGNIWACTEDGRAYPATVVGTDPRIDLAVLKIAAGDLRPVRFSANPAARGLWTLAIGNPFGLAAEGGMALSVGVVSAVDRTLPRLNTVEHRFYAGLIQTTAEINPGNSGGPLFDLAGDVIGINTAVIMPQANTNGIGFAISITPAVLQRIDDLKHGREVVYGYLGVNVSTPTPEQRTLLGASDDRGVMVDAVESKSPADGVLSSGDIVLAVAGQPMHNSEEMVRTIGATPVDKLTELTIVREGRQRVLEVQLRRRVLPSVQICNTSQNANLASAKN